MNPAGRPTRSQPGENRNGFGQYSAPRFLSIALCLLVLTGCSVIPFRREPPRPGRTTLKSPLIELPAHNVGNFLLLETKWDRSGPYRFLIDTGSSVTLVTPALARRYPSKALPPPSAPRVRVAAADGAVTELPAGWLRHLALGDAHFDDVPVLLYDCAALSAHLGMRIDGVLGFPLFREILLTLDYPGSRIRLQPARNAPLVPGSTVPFDDALKTPVIHIGLGDRSLIALIDSGSDAGLSLNPLGMKPRFSSGPRPGGTVGTIAGDRTQQIGRLADNLTIGGYVMPDPIVELTDELSVIGGGVLKHFTVTFDQERDRVTFYRESRDSIPTGSRRSAGVSFSKTPAYWKIAGIVPHSPAEAAELRRGELVTRINGEPVANWDLPRYDQLIATAREITFSLLNGNHETPKTVAVFDLVP
jgi:hypothetical protein